MFSRVIIKLKLEVVILVSNKFTTQQMSTRYAMFDFQQQSNDVEENIWG